MIKSVSAKFAIATGLLFSLSACATTFPIGSLYSDVTLPIEADDTQSGAPQREGRACSQSILSLVATGDSSIDAAKRNGGISDVISVDWEVNNILGVVGTYCTVVRGN